MVLTSDRRAVDERGVLDLLLRAMKAAVMGWMNHSSCQCLVSGCLAMLLPCHVLCAPPCHASCSGPALPPGAKLDHP
jgi:hypothetical protein